jgi:anti-sigma28 factor (negative regulator of flagellin synthesis)
MRIDALNRAPIPRDAEKSGPTAPQIPLDKEAGAGSDQAKISQLAQSLTTPDADRIEQLRLQVQSGNYDVSADALAAAIIDSHLKE